MTAPGLTCARCGQALYPQAARRTDDGWVHTGRTGCLTARQAAERVARIEDVRWLAETGECLTGAAKRMGMSRGGLQRFLKANELHEEYRALLSREAYELNFHGNAQVVA